ncbi:hypothetical protein DSM21852_24670 [Methylocystis bryophila]|uniref:Uncharacterized protein n=1 Tax=Methylocystis bryophila TaxID=655015 RepID=A0A1W6MZF9_9HYPH|nr:hypothetical protein B1812_19685 [Methylocystis bryophila]BDV39214.1 hypothetical protein DSM21852_24670 [Methylocystis bryophila]
MLVRLILLVAATLALGAPAWAAPLGADGLVPRSPLQRVAECVKQTDCGYRWLRCGKGWCRGPFDSPFGGGVPKVEMQCVTTCAPEQQESLWDALFGRNPAP